jgi:hypothetical protein
MKHVCPPKKCTVFGSNKRMHLWDSFVYNLDFEAFESIVLRKFRNW